MRIVSCLALIAVTGISGSEANAQHIVASQGSSGIRNGGTALITLQYDAVTVRQALADVAKQGRKRLVLNESLPGLATKVSVNLKGASVANALVAITRGTGLVAQVLDDGDIISVAAVGAKGAKTATGIVTGRVIDSKTKQPLRGATVVVEGTTLQASTSDDGRFRIPDVPEGSRTVNIRMLGYAKQSQQVTVGDGQSAITDVLLEPSASVLDQLVVTGTIVQTELKAVPTAITVVTAKQIEERGITKIDQLFRGDIPGLFAQNQGSNTLLDEVTMFSRGVTALSGSSVGNAYLTNPIKTYVDGVEVADSKYLSQIDPKSIERIEILTGPQASTIYGSNAINGVMQIFTKRGSTSHPQLTLNLLSGFVQNNFSSARTPQHDYDAQLSGVEGRLSYNAGGSWNYVGPWTPAKQTARTSGFGGARLELPTPVGRVTADMTLRRTITQTLQRGDANQTSTSFRENGRWLAIGNAGLVSPNTRTLNGQTLGLELSYAPTSWWSHELGVGFDVSDAEIRGKARGYRDISDTTLPFFQNHADRRSFRYSTTARIAVTSLAQLAVTAGADAWANLVSSLNASPLTLTGSLTNISFISRQPGHNTGGFVQTQLGVKDKLFVTYGLRAEWNPYYGAEAQPNMAPRYGVAYAQDFGPITTKLRGSFGRSTRPPAPLLKAAKKIADSFSPSSLWLPYYGNFDYYLANPELGPEHQQGGEGGVELYLGTRGSLVVTRYNQTVDGLLAAPTVDSVRSLVPCPSESCAYHILDADGFGYYRQIQYLNIGSIRNQGWELQGNVHVGPITTRGTYSWTKSRTIGVSSQYRAYFANQTQYQPNATFRYLPEHTWALGVTYAVARSSVGLNVMGTGRATNQPNDFAIQNLVGNIRLLQNRLNVTNPSYVSFNSAYALADLTASHRFAPTVEGVLQVQNLADRYINDNNANFATIGRQTKLGLRLRTP